LEFGLLPVWRQLKSAIWYLLIPFPPKVTWYNTDTMTLATGRLRGGYPLLQQAF
jgi:hypothetical protein